VITKPLLRPDEERIKNILLVPSATSLLAPTITLPEAFGADGVADAVGVDAATVATALSCLSSGVCHCNQFSRISSCN
jgi:hypothetical protein